MSSSRIEVFARIRPTKHPSNQLAYKENTVVLDRVKDPEQGYINHTQEHYDYKFSGVFGPDSIQDEIFDGVAKNVVSSVLDGFNGTLFAYGQTGSGKTFTMTGGADSYAQRGIIPRTLSYMFSEFKKRSDQQYMMHISYIEIYNEAGYDLLDPVRDTKKPNADITDLPRVRLREDAEGMVHLSGLGIHRVTSEDEALNQLFIGDTNRVIAENAFNPVSSRSHCIFTVWIESSAPGSDVVRRSKLHLVDLAGSERVAKSAVTGKLLTEAKHINLSLHHLEHVIVSLSDKTQHVPYRNSMMTTILRDSLGGNCKTVMIATLSMHDDHLDETISTCRFAQRVACISNVLSVNEELDPKLKIKRLMKENAELKAEIAFLKGGSGSAEPLSEEMKDKIRGQVQAFVDDADPDSMLAFTDLRMIREGFFNLKRMVISAGIHPRGSTPARVGSAPPVSQPTLSSADKDSQAKLEKLERLLQHRDNEINILVGMVEKARAGVAAGDHDVIISGPQRPPLGMRQSQELLSRNSQDMMARPSAESPQPLPRASEVAVQKIVEMGVSEVSAVDSAKLLEQYRLLHRDKDQIIEENKVILQDRYEQAKATGEIVKKAKAQVEELKKKIQQERMDEAVRQAAAGLTPNENEQSLAERKLREEIAQWNQVGQSNFGKLRDLKQEIEQLQKLLERSKASFMKDFDVWSRQQQARASGSTPTTGLPPRSRAGSDLLPSTSTQSAYSSNQSALPPSLSSSQSSPHSVHASYPPPMPSSSHPLPPQPPSVPVVPIRTGSTGSLGSSVTLTGDKQADEEIMRFRKARELRMAQQAAFRG